MINLPEYEDFSLAIHDFYQQKIDIKLLSMISLKSLIQIHASQEFIKDSFSKKNYKETEYPQFVSQINQDYFDYELINDIITSGNYVDKKRFSKEILDILSNLSITLESNQDKAVDLFL